MQSYILILALVVGVAMYNTPGAPEPVAIGRSTMQVCDPWRGTSCSADVASPAA